MSSETLIKPSLIYCLKINPRKNFQDWSFVKTNPYTRLWYPKLRYLIHRKIYPCKEYYFIRVCYFIQVIS